MKNFKKFTAVTLVAAMTFGSAMTVFAEEAGVGEGTGSYEGGEMKYPTLTVTLPTIPAGTYDYIADPNGLIEETKNDDGTASKYADSTFTGTTGIFFLTSTADDGAKTYTDKSAALTLDNENAQDIDVTVKLEQKTAGDAAIKYAENADFDAEDKENKLYLAITDGKTTDPEVAALSAEVPATITTTVAGVPENYVASYDATTQKYGYVKKEEADLTDWNGCSFNMAGALNKGATWGDSVTFPEIKVTWSYAEHVDGVDANGSVSGGELWLSVDGTNGFSAQPSSFKIDGTLTTAYTYHDGGWISMEAPSSGSVVQFVVESTTYKFILP
ncbi:MAG: hypothetical protein HFH13_08975 [Dorea sp.]|jgi:hypothetical protein|nr:hypothetical protein [Dorea sp.]